MRNSLRAFVLVLFFTALGATTASGQSYTLVANQSDLTPSGGTADAQCLIQLSSGAYVFFNSDEGGIYTWDGSSLGVHTSPSDLNSNITATSSTIDRCDLVTTDGSGTVYFSFRASDETDQPNYIYRTEAADASNNDFAEYDGAVGLAFYNSTLYFASYAFFEDTGTREDGIYSLPPDLSASPTEVATNPDLSIDRGIDVSDSGTLYAYSNGFSGGSFGEVIVSLDLTAQSPSFQVFTDPYASGSPLTASDDNIDALEVVKFGGNDFIVLLNNVSDASNGEEYGIIRVADESISILFTEDDLTTNLSVSGYVPGFSEPFSVASDGSVTIASRDDSGVSDYLARVSGAPPLPVELTSFTVETDAQQAVLTWTTATETNNAGFEVQHQAPGAAAWSQIGFEQGAGTTTEARSYRFATDALQPGVHTFRLRQVDTDGTESVSDTRRVEIAAAQAVAFAGPNPVSAGDRPRVTVQLDRAQDVTIRVYNVLGQQVDQLYRGVLPAGEVLEASVSTANLSSGMYFLRVQGPSVNEVKKFTVVK